MQIQEVVAVDDYERVVAEPDRVFANDLILAIGLARDDSCCIPATVGICLEGPI